MKRAFTESKKANRSSAWSKSSSFRGQSPMRRDSRAGVQPQAPRLSGLQVFRTQAIKIRKAFRTIVRTISHPRCSN